MLPLIFMIHYVVLRKFPFPLMQFWDLKYRSAICLSKNSSKRISLCLPCTSIGFAWTLSSSELVIHCYLQSHFIQYVIPDVSAASPTQQTKLWLLNVFNSNSFEVSVVVVTALNNVTTKNRHISFAINFLVNNFYRPATDG